LAARHDPGILVDDRAGDASGTERPPVGKVTTVKLLLWVDVEGITGIDDAAMLKNAATLRHLTTAEVNAAVAGIRAAAPGAEIAIFDGHGMGGNLDAAALAPGCRLLGGGWMTTLMDMVLRGALADYHGALLLGQHAAAGTVRGFITHTNTSFTALRVNGRDAGEAPEAAWLLGHFGVPALLVTGDDAVTREAQALLPAVATVAVKRAVNRRRAESMPKMEAHRQVAAAAEQAVRERNEHAPYRLGAPIDIEVLYATEAMAATGAQLPGMARRGPCRVGIQVEDFVEGWRAYNTGRIVGEMHRLTALLDRLRKDPNTDRAIDVQNGAILRDWLKDPSPFPPVRY
jgi:D-amino peptidase